MKMDNEDPNDNAKEIHYASKNYAFSGKIMLIAIVLLFVIIITMLCLHVYVRWRLLRTRRRLHLRRSRRPQFVFYAPQTALTVATRGLHPSVISSLPVFTFSPTTTPAECAVCLSYFENGETGRILPKCNHSFHIDCIDMWFQSHSTCPLCRTLVEPRPEITEAVCEPEPVSSSETCVECQREGEELNRSGPVGASSSLHVEVPARNESLGHEPGCESHSSFHSPVSRILSFKRILSREKKGSVSACVGGCSAMTEFELDVERGDSLPLPFYHLPSLSVFVLVEL
ncbi:hypothetical protein VNO77_05699 [Canavalia gladiata]|uniref:RING-type E3 ubiquitin transferase n=1 Tax=Canavalia gladiata TaxID=3824 RepID=A0AAN9N405_CANGL